MLQVCDSPEPQKVWTRVDIGVAATTFEQLTFPEVGYLVACSHSHSRPALLCTLGNCISQAPLPSGFLVGLDSGKHWQEGGGENPRYVSRSASGSLYTCGWSSLWPLLHGLRSCWTGPAMLPISVRWHQIQDTNNTVSSL